MVQIHRLARAVAGFLGGVQNFTKRHSMIVWGRFDHPHQAARKAQAIENKQIFVTFREDLGWRGGSGATTVGKLISLMRQGMAGNFCKDQEFHGCIFEDPFCMTKAIHIVDRLQQSNRNNYELSPNDHSKIGVSQW